MFCFCESWNIIGNSMKMILYHHWSSPVIQIPASIWMSKREILKKAMKWWECAKRHKVFFHFIEGSKNIWLLFIATDLIFRLVFTTDIKSLLNGLTAKRTHTHTHTYIYIYIDRCTNMKKHSLQKMVLFIVELFANVKRFGSLILNLYSGVYICDCASEIYRNCFSLFVKWNKHFEPPISDYSILFQTCDSIKVRNLFQKRNVFP